ncbi:flagellar brake protein [Alicyclobacillus acidiphilus]|uniref:flagellar brake protein n=1 Tax=Alicyclobacillus acidiphilus TaxID=182455 RepID=UPI00082CAEF1|nr:PilZ domain-containing protein [Alicyclobacillus acidiphilus]
MPVTPHVGTSVRLRIEGDTVHYKSRVADVSEEFLFIDVPTHPFTMKDMEIQLDTKVRLEYAASESDVYQYSSPILGIAYIPTAAVRLLSPERADDLERIQRREYFRISIDTRVKLQVERTNQEYVTQSLDISGGGLAVIDKTRLDVEPGDIVFVSLVLPYIEFKLDIPCQVVRQSEDELGNFITSMRFVDIKERERDQVIRYTFMRQRALKR